MFWKNLPSSPQIDTAFFKEELTLNELLDQENVLQELKSQNAKLIDFITRPDIMSQLVSLVTEEPSAELDEAMRYQRPNLACEVLTTDIRILNERLSDKNLLAKLYSFLEADPPLNPLLASFFSRTLSMLICRKTDQNWYSYQFTCLQVLDFFKSCDNSLGLLLKHLGTSAIMDLTLKLITQIEGEDMQRIIFNWLENEGLVSRLMSLFDPSVDSDRQYNAAQLLCDTIHKCRDMACLSSEHKDIGPILSAIQSPEMTEKLLGHMLGGELSESSIVGGISVLLTLLGPSPSSTGSGEPAEVLNPPLSTISAIVPYLPKLHDLLINPPKKDTVKLACGTVDPPLGSTRLSVVKLLAALIATNTLKVNEMLDELGTINVLLDLFFHYTWNNFLHTQVGKCLAFALNSSEDIETNPLISSIFIKCRLLQRILEAWKENEAEQSKDGGKRRGYMGHLTNIASTVVKHFEGGNDFLNKNVDPDTMTAWNDFVETTLGPINVMKERCLGGRHPAHSTPKDEEVIYKDIIISDESYRQNIIPEFQEKMRDCMENCRFTNFENDLFQMDNAELKAREEAFSKMCSNMDPMDPGIFTMSQNLEDNVWLDLPNSVWNTSDDLAPNSSDEDEKGSSGIGADDGYGDTDLWSSVGVGTPIVDPGNPWKCEGVDRTGAAPEENANEGWADFSSNLVTEVNFPDEFSSTEQQQQQANFAGKFSTMNQQQQANFGNEFSTMEQGELANFATEFSATEQVNFTDKFSAELKQHQFPVSFGSELTTEKQQPLLDFSDEFSAEQNRLAEFAPIGPNLAASSVDRHSNLESSIEERFEAAIQLSPSQVSEQPSVSEDQKQSSSEVLTSETRSKENEPPGSAESPAVSSDNNTNLSSVAVSQEDTVVQNEELFDNFRFLSKKGMISDEVAVQNQETVKQCSEEQNVGPRSCPGANDTTGDPV